MKKKFMLVLGIFAFPVWICAQADTPININSGMKDATKTNPSVVYPVEVTPLEIISDAAYDPPPTEAVKYSPDIFKNLTSSSLPGSFSQEAAWDLRNNFGFSLSAQEGYYSSDNSTGITDSDSSWSRSSSATSLSASVFTNYASGKSAMHLDYGAGYSFYPDRQKSADSINHSVSASYMYRMSDRASFRLRDQFTSTSKDPFGDVFSINSSFGRISSGSYYFDAIFSPYRYNRNTVTATVNSDITGKGTNVSGYGSYENYWYGEQNEETGVFKDYYSARVGIGINQRITSWLSLGSTYSVQFNDDLKDSQVNRLEIGNFQFSLSENVEIHVSGGLEFTDTSYGEEGYKTNVLARAGISYSIQRSRLYAEYARTTMSSGGFGRRLPSDTFSIGLGQPIGDRVNLRLIGYYQRSSDFYDSGNLSAYQTQAAIEYLIAPGLAASANYTYRYQKNSISSLHGIPHADRSTISGGLQYTWPSRRSGY